MVLPKIPWSLYLSISNKVTTTLKYLLSISDVRGQGFFSARFRDRWFQSAVENQRRRVSQLRANLVGKESILTAGCATSTGSSRKPVSGNCHMEAHNRLNCEFGQCLSVTYCNLLEKHPDEKKEMASIKRQLKSEENKVRTIRGRTNSKSCNCILSSESLFL